MALLPRAGGKIVGEAFHFMMFIFLQSHLPPIPLLQGHKNNMLGIRNFVALLNPFIF